MWIGRYYAEKKKAEKKKEKKESSEEEGKKNKKKKEKEAATVQRLKSKHCSNGSKLELILELIQGFCKACSSRINSSKLIGNDLNKAWKSNFF